MSDLDVIARVRQRTELLTIAETAELLNVSDDTVRRLIARGSLCAIRVASVIRIDPTQLAVWLASSPATKAAEPIAAEDEGEVHADTRI
jgi:excisionase family DNA binding protein